MQKKQMLFKTKGMNRDLSVSAFNPEFAFENVNLRLSTNEGNTLMSWVNEKGTKDTGVEFVGTPIGTAVINHMLVVFTTEDGDRIYVVRKYTKDDTAVRENPALEGTYYSAVVYKGNLNFSTNNPLETLASYETDNIQKVYWTDNLNQPRIANIAALLKETITDDSGEIDTRFDFITAVDLTSSISIEKFTDGGMFVPGVIQYCYTYYNKYGQQSNIINVSSLNYLTHNNRGANASETVNNSFRITINAPDHDFNMVRLYSIHRSSIDTVPDVRVLEDFTIYDDTTLITYIDTGTNGSTIDPTELLFIGGKEIRALTMGEKDNTLFLGNISMENSNIDKIHDYFKANRSSHEDSSSPLISFNTETKTLVLNDPTGNLYSNTFTLNKSRNEITTFKGGDYYRFGFQLQKYTGEWSDPVFIGDFQNDKYPVTNIDSTDVGLVAASGVIDLNPFINGAYRIDDFLKIYKRIRPVIVYPEVYDRCTLCQGVLNPTVFNIQDRQEKIPYAQASWYFRPYTSKEQELASLYDVHIAVGSTESVPSVKLETVREDKYYSVMLLRIRTQALDHYLTSGYIDFETGDGEGEEQYPYYGALKLGVVYIKREHTDLYATEFTDMLFWVDRRVSLEPRGMPLSFDTCDHCWGGPEGDNQKKQQLLAWTRNRGYLLPEGVVRDAQCFLKYIGEEEFVEFNIQFNEGDFKEGLDRVDENTPVDSGLGFVGVYTIKLYKEKEENLANSVAYRHYESVATADNMNYKVLYENYTKDVNPYLYESRTYFGNSTMYAARAEIQGSMKKYRTPFIASNALTNIPSENITTNNQFFVDQSIVTLNSPDLEFDTFTQTYNNEDLKLRIIGMIPITSNASAHQIVTTGAMYPLGYQEKDNRDQTKEGSGFGIGEMPVNVYWMNKSEHAGSRLVGGYLWQDSHLGFNRNTVYYSSTSPVEYLVYPWHASRSFTNDKRTNEQACSVLKTKIESTLLYSYNTSYFNKCYKFKNDADSELSVSAQVHLAENDFIENLRLDGAHLGNIDYYPNIEKTLVNDISWNIYSKYISLYGNFTNPVLMKYKSGTHAAIALPEHSYDPDQNGYKVSRMYILPYAYYNTVGRNNINAVRTPATQDVDLSRPGMSEYPLHFVIADGEEIGYIDDGGYPGEGTGGDSETPDIPSVIHDDDSQGNNEIGKYIGSSLFSHPYWEEDSKKLLSFRQGGILLSEPPKYDFLWLGELYKEPKKETLFGGRGTNAVHANTWLPAGEAKNISDNGKVQLEWTEGDTYYQRYDCLKTYPFSNEDPNQLVEILSFMCETHVNLDGRYDRNRGLKDNTNVSITNFNLVNPVYSQKDNFFSYKKPIEKVTSFPNLITFTKTKEAGADIDAWTNITLSSNLELDGSMGEISSIQRVNNQLIALQNSGIAQILYNESVQIASTEGVPIEIGNSKKVEGKRYYSNSIGCSNKYSICNTPSGIYFIDSNDKGIYLFNGELNNLSNKFGFNTWCKTNIFSNKKWTPTGFEDFVTYYDRQNQDVLFINDTDCLAFSEKLGVFTSFYSYQNSPYFTNLDDDGLWLKDGKLWLHRGGDYCNFFGTNEPFSMTLVGNPEPQVDKTFTNLEFRAGVDGEGITSDNSEGTTAKYKPFLPFDKLETWNEYQRGYTNLKDKDGHNPYKHHDGVDSTLLRKFRIWRCDIPRDNDTTGGRKAHPMDRMRNPWLYLKLSKEEKEEDTSKRTEIHDVVMTYFV